VELEPVLLASARHGLLTPPSGAEMLMHCCFPGLAPGATFYRPLRGLWAYARSFDLSLICMGA
jgi:hypothetical protein